MMRRSRETDEADHYSKEEAERRRDAAVVRALNTPPKPRRKPKVNDERKRPKTDE
jgi:hypothetical protein